MYTVFCIPDFPINDLLSATELDRIRTSVQAIFSHLRKIRNTKYPIQRALRLVEAISRDVVVQMLKVLGTRRLMVIAFEEFEKVMANCFEVFSTWDDEYDKLQGLMRDIVKKKRDEHLKMVWRVNFSHKRLQVSQICIIIICFFKRPSSCIMPIFGIYLDTYYIVNFKNKIS